jgi:hypothetical protein
VPQLADARTLMAASNIAARDAHSRSHHGREKKTIRRRYRSIRSYVEKGAAPLGDAGVLRIGRDGEGLLSRNVLILAKSFD